MNCLNFNLIFLIYIEQKKNIEPEIIEKIQKGLNDLKSMLFIWNFVLGMFPNYLEICINLPLTSENNHGKENPKL